ncbi:curli assembly protein CsgF [Thalassotalea piscium]|uniref:Curli production assembly/transport component CsgF n=1 Tax=Thalassotalea piscium TaxID=1230533 RepID=A0A7X0NK57_9GAMM|nr:curli assembly protein CsgF [Thalassotalea piscium]MBB6544957.1 curli production assembly/transport component CsgF [Thalassotalea piscium]
MNISKSVFLTLILATSWANASELVYKPINPSFGGNPMNGSFLLGKAQAQNKHKAPLNRKSYAEKFQESLERAYINKMVREITDLAFGDTCDVATDAECEPSIFNEDSIFTSGDYLIEIITSNTDSITVQITNSLTGEITIIEVPRFG